MDSLLREMQGVQEVDVDIDEGSATLRYDASITDTEKMKRVLIDGTFNVTGVVELD